jgi:hypothetical protein
VEGIPREGLSPDLALLLACEAVMIRLSEGQQAKQGLRCFPGGFS